LGAQQRLLSTKAEIKDLAALVVYQFEFIAA
jgi:hypothetical protein